MLNERRTVLAHSFGGFKGLPSVTGWLCSYSAVNEASIMAEGVEVSCLPYSQKAFRQEGAGDSVCLSRAMLPVTGFLQ